MNAEIKAQWVAALRSGKYKQGRQQLRSAQDEYCCLGVLGCLIAPEGWKRPRYTWVLDGESLFSLVDRAGLSISRGDQSKLANLNDFGVVDSSLLVDKHTPATFAQIADWIEANL